MKKVKLLYVFKEDNNDKQIAVDIEYDGKRYGGYIPLLKEV